MSYLARSMTVEISPEAALMVERRCEGRLDHVPILI
jgi:hypothetical protein